MLTVVENIPEGFLDVDPQRLDEVLRGPTLIHLPGKKARPLFVSVLLHGNEPTGLMAIQALLRHYLEQPLPRALSIFVGNVAAASLKQRRLEGQCDYNRIWQEGDTEAHLMAARVVQEMSERAPFASIDIHNNTGLNPHYACINKLDNRFLRLARLFSRTIVYFTRPEGVQSMAFSALCPAVTLECGQPGQAYGAEHAMHFVQAVLNLEEIDSIALAADEYDLFHTVAVVKVPEALSFGFGVDEVDIEFLREIDHYNFREIAPGTCFGRIHNPAARLLCQGECGEDLGAKYFSYQGGRIELATAAMPAMLTLNERVIRQDCFGYLMERLAAPVS